MSFAEWTGAVGSHKAASSFDPALTLRVLRQVLSRPLGDLAGSPEALDLLLYAAAEWGDLDCAKRVQEELSGLSAKLFNENPPREFFHSGSNLEASLIRVFCDASSFFKREDWTEAIRLLVKFLERFYDEERGAFGDENSAGPVVASQNALAALALLRASSHFKNEELGLKAERALRFIQDKLYDPLLGLVHQIPAKAGSLEYGHLGDCAWAALALSEAYLQSGNKSYRDFADILAKYIFQELWDREKGGFFPRLEAEGEGGSLSREIISGNAAAFEALWRLRYLKGNNAYSKWVHWGLHRFLDDPLSNAHAESLIRVLDMSARGRLELEIVGRAEDAGAQKLLKALAGLYAPRKIISFVDPDDQDYILAHGLEAPSYPRLFGCVGLKRCADTSHFDFESVSKVLDAAWPRRQLI